MFFASRIYSFYDHGATSMEETFSQFEKIEGLTHVDLNYPEHLAGLTLNEMRQLAVKHHLTISGLSMRFRKEYIKGDYGNPNPKIAENAFQLTKDAIDACVALSAQYLTIYIENDGFDYCFQLDYARSFGEIVRYVKAACAYAKEKGILVSFEYKPYEPRKFMMIDSFGMSMYLVEKAGADNLGVTLDYCHMLMKKENPACGLAIALSQGKLDAIHLNDGWGRNDDGLMVAAATPVNMAEFIYYLRKYNFDGLVFFDTFPILEDPLEECKTNIKIFKKIWNKIGEIGVEKFDEIVKKNDAVTAVSFLMDELFFN